MESFHRDDDHDHNKDKTLDYSRILEQNKPNSKLYLQAKEKLRGRLVEQGIQRTMPHLVNKQLFQPSNIIPKRVLEGYKFYEARQEQSTFMQRNRMGGNPNDISSIVDTSMNQNQNSLNRTGMKLPKLPPLDGKPTGKGGKRSQSVAKGTGNNILDDSRLINQDMSFQQDRTLNDSNLKNYEENTRINAPSYIAGGNANNTSGIFDPKRRMSIKGVRAPSPRNATYVRTASPNIASLNAGYRGGQDVTKSVLNPIQGQNKPGDTTFDDIASKTIIDKLTGRNIPSTRMQGANRQKRAMSIKSRASSFMIDPLDAGPVGNILQDMDLGPTDQAVFEPEGQSPQVSRLQDVDSFIYLIKEKQINPSEFIYLVKREDDHYNLKLADFVNIKEKVYYTLSSNGVTRYEKGLPVEFITLKDWLRERDQYNHIKQLRFFTQFRAWKTLKKWIRILRRNHKNQIISQLNEKLFIANPIFQQLIVNHKGMCLEIEALRFIELLRLETGEIQSLDDFKLNQEKKRASVVENLQNFSHSLHENARAGIKIVLKALRDHIQSETANDEDQFNEELKELTSGVKNKPVERGSGKNVFGDLEFPEFLNYVHRSMLRHECTRFLRLAYLLDFMTVEALGNMYLGSVRDFTRKLDVLFKQCEDNPALGEEGQEGRRQATDPLFFVSVRMDAVEVDSSQIENKEIGTEIKNVEDFDLMNFAQFEVSFFF